MGGGSGLWWLSGVRLGPFSGAPSTSLVRLCECVPLASFFFCCAVRPHSLFVLVKVNSICSFSDFINEQRIRMHEKIYQASIFPGVALLLALILLSTSHFFLRLPLPRLHLGDGGALIKAGP